MLRAAALRASAEAACGVRRAARMQAMSESDLFEDDESVIGDGGESELGTAGGPSRTPRCRELVCIWRCSRQPYPLLAVDWCICRRRRRQPYALLVSRHDLARAPLVALQATARARWERTWVTTWARRARASWETTRAS
eukprot:2114412-Prymnesium_polylepis.1